MVLYVLVAFDIFDFYISFEYSFMDWKSNNYRQSNAEMTSIKKEATRLGVTTFNIEKFEDG